MKKVFWILAVLLLVMVPLPVLAADNTIQIELPKDMGGTSIQYYQEGCETKEIQVNQDGIVSLLGLTDGTYHFLIPETEGYIFEPITVTVPYIETETNEKNYDLVIHPKYRIKPEENQGPETGDNQKSLLYVGIGIISLIIVVIMSCHNRFKCDRMTDKYSRKRRI